MMAGASHLVPAFHNVARDLDFLFYRSRPRADPGPEASTLGGAGGGRRGRLSAAAESGDGQSHRCGASRQHRPPYPERPCPAGALALARLGGTDCAAGIAFLSAGTMVQGWACYAEDLLLEALGLLHANGAPAAEAFRAAQRRQRLPDIRFIPANGHWRRLGDSTARKRASRPTRVDGEVTRIDLSGEPARRIGWASKGSRSFDPAGAAMPVRFDDDLIGHGHVPVAWVESEMQLAGKIT